MYYIKYIQYDGLKEEQKRNSVLNSSGIKEKKEHHELSKKEEMIKYQANSERQNCSYHSCGRVNSHKEIFLVQVERGTNDEGRAGQRCRKNNSYSCNRKYSQ